MSTLSYTRRRQHRHADAFGLNLNCSIDQLVVFKPRGQVFSFEALVSKELCKHFTGKLVAKCARGKTENTAADRRSDSGEGVTFLLICIVTGSLPAAGIIYDLVNSL